MAGADRSSASGSRRISRSWPRAIPTPTGCGSPSAQDLAAAFPTKALQDGTAGKAAIKCGVTIEGFLERCVVLFESPADFGFGAAALQLSPQFRMSPKIRGGKPVPGGDVTIPINWEAPAAGGRGPLSVRAG
jgi:TonB family protein